MVFAAATHRSANKEASVLMFFRIPVTLARVRCPEMSAFHQRCRTGNYFANLAHGVG
jgi:hypothetical protein